MPSRHVDKVRVIEKDCGLSGLEMLLVDGAAATAACAIGNPFSELAQEVCSGAHCASARAEDHHSVFFTIAMVSA